MFSSKRIKELEAQIEVLSGGVAQAWKEIEDLPVLVSIERDGRLNKFTFKRNCETYMIETMGLLGDDIAEWKGNLLG